MMQSKRIAMFNIHSDPVVAIGTQENGGQNVYVRSLMNELDRLGWSVDVFTRWNDSRKKQIFSVGKRSRVIRLKAGPIAHVPKADLREHLPAFYKSFLDYTQSQNIYDYFHGHYWDGGYVAMLASEQFQKPFAQTYHSLGKVRFNVKKQYENRDLDNHFDVRFDVEEKVGQHASRIIALSETEKEDLVSLYNVPTEKIRVIPGGVNFRQFHAVPRKWARSHLHLSPDTYIVMYVGRLEWRKGIGTLIGAATQLKKEIADFQIVIVGGGIFAKNKNKDDYKEYQRLITKAQEEGVESNIRFLGRADHSQLATYYSAADVLAVPSYYEPFGLVALEGMACQVPLVASRIGGLKTIIQEGFNGLLFEPRNALDLASKIMSLNKSSDLVHRLTQQALEDVYQSYSWKEIVQKIAAVYEENI